jgi:hypothetical protein
VTEDFSHRTARNPAFQQVVATAMEFFPGQAAVVKDMDDGRRRRYVDTANALRADARRETEANREAPFEELGALAEITRTEARTLTPRVRDAAQQFVTAFAELRPMNERRQIDTLTDAVKRDPVLISAVERLVRAGSAGVGEESPQTCQAICPRPARHVHGSGHSQVRRRLGRPRPARLDTAPPGVVRARRHRGLSGVHGPGVEHPQRPRRWQGDDVR